MLEIYTPSRLILHWERLTIDSFLDDDGTIVPVDAEALVPGDKCVCLWITVVSVLVSRMRVATRIGPLIPVAEESASPFTIPDHSPGIAEATLLPEAGQQHIRRLPNDDGKHEITNNGGAWMRPA